MGLVASAAGGVSAEAGAVAMGAEALAARATDGGSMHGERRRADDEAVSARGEGGLTDVPRAALLCGDDRGMGEVGGLEAVDDGLGVGG